MSDFNLRSETAVVDGTAFEKNVGKIVSLFAVAFSLFHLYLAGIGLMSLSASRHIHLILSMVLIFASMPISGMSPRRWTFYLDVLLIILAVSIGAYLELQVEALEWRAGEPNVTDLIFGVIAILLTLEITRRTVGWPLVITSLMFLAYAVFGDIIPGYFGHRGYGLEMLVNSFYIEMRGIYGTALGVVVEFVVLFVVFGAFLQKSGGGDFFVKFAYALTGKLRGGPAKTAVIASALMGSISGSATANVVTTGSFTIPMMKKTGFSAHDAAGVEVASSVGGVLMPPIMGAAAFLIVALTGISYGEIIKAAALPSVMYFVSVYSAVHFKSCKLGIQGAPHEGSYWRNLFNVLKTGVPYIVPLLLIFVLLVSGYSPTYSAFGAIVVLVVLSSLKKKGRMGWRDILGALELGAKNSLTVSAACACVGLIVGVVGLTGVGVKFSSLIATGAGNVFTAIIFVGLASLVLGIELPITASYLVLAILAAPALSTLGVPILVAHLIVLWFSIDAAVTPPVCITSFVAAGIAEANPFKTAVAAWRVAKGLYIIPFLMAYTHICLNGTLFEIVTSFVTGTVGLIALSAAWQGWFFDKTGFITRTVLAVVAVTAIVAEPITDIAGIVLFLAVIAAQFYSKTRRENRLRLSS